MSDVKWIKLTTDMFEDEKISFIETLPEADSILVIWIRLLSMAGRLNCNGWIFLTEKIPFTEEFLAHKFRKPINVVRLAFKTLEQLEMIQVDEKGILICNWDKHQNIEGLEKIREQNRLRKQRQRDREAIPEKCHVTSRDSHATDIDLELDKEEEEEKIPYQKVVDAYHEILKDLPGVRKVTSKRKKHIGARHKELGSIDEWKKYFQTVKDSDYLMGKIKEWKADFDWLINETNCAKVLEGKYTNRKSEAKQNYNFEF